MVSPFLFDGGSSMVTGRLAPSPTGAQHIGNARTYLLAWLSARAQQGRVLLRIEDLDSPRVKPWAVQQSMDDLRWLGLDWDEEPVLQTTQRDAHERALLQLQQAERVYPCTCTRSDIEAAASAPHLGQEGPVYPGTCSKRRVETASSLTPGSFAWRFRTDQTSAEGQEEWSSPSSGRLWQYTDILAGPQRCLLAAQLGDFAVAKGDGTPAYQLAVVVDDHRAGVTEVIRGDDLIPSTFRQLALYEALGWVPPRFGHVPLVIGTDGRRLAKRHGDTRITLLRERGIPAERLVGFLAWCCGLLPHPEPITPRALIARFDWSLVPAQPLIFTETMWNDLASSAS